MAGLIPQNFIDDLLTRIDIIDVIDGYVTLKKTGKNHQARCPFHEEKTPSFTVSQDKQFYHCFGCGANGTAITFLMDYAGMDFVEAIEELASRAGLQVPRDGKSTASQDANQTELYELMEMVIRFYKQQLREHAQAHIAVDYLKQRGISGKLAAEFELGFAPPGWDNLLNNLGTSDAAQLRLVKAGMILKKESGGYYDRFRNRIMYPIRDNRGRAIAFGGRVIDENDTPKYLNSPETSIFHKGRELYGLHEAKHHVKDTNKLYIVEGYMDVLALAQNGIRNSVATLGTAVTSDHIDRLFRVCPNLIFCFDGDDAGKKAAWRSVSVAIPLLRDGRQCMFLFFPEGDDPDSYVRSHGREHFENNTTLVPLSEFLLDTLKKDIDLTTSEGRAALANKTLPYLGQMPENSLRELLLNSLADLTRLGTDYLKSQLHSDDGKSSLKQPSSRITPSSRHTPSNLISDAIRLILHHPALANFFELDEQINTNDIAGLDFLLELTAFIKQRPNTSCASILEHWRNTKYEHRLKELAASEILLSSWEEFEQEFLDIIEKIHTSGKRRKLRIQKQNVGTVDELRRLYSDDPKMPE